MEQAEERQELESPIVLTYVSDVYRFLAFFLLCYAVGVYLPMVHPNFFRMINHHYFFISTLVCTLATILGFFCTFFGSVGSLCFGILGSRYLHYMLSLQPSLVMIAGIGTFMIFMTATMCSRFFRVRQVVMFSGLFATLIELTILFLLFSTRYDVVLSLFIMTFYIYYDTSNVFERAKINVIRKNRNSLVVMDAFCLFLDIINIFTFMLRRSKPANKSKDN